MCSISDKFKLCSCKGDALKEAAAFWKLFRKIPESELKEIMLGELMMPAPIDPARNEENRKNILARLRDPDVFDVEPPLREEDLLVLIFKSVQNEYADREYSFQYLSGKWEPSDLDYFDRENDFRANRKGIVQDPG